MRNIQSPWGDCTVDGYSPSVLLPQWLYYGPVTGTFIFSCLISDVYWTSGQILFLGPFLRRIYSMSVSAFLCTGTQSTPVTAVIQCQIKHYTFLLVGEWQFENFTYKTEICQLLVTQSTFSCFYPVESVLPGLTLTSLWIQPVSEPWQLFPSGKRSELHWLKCLLATLKPDSQL